MSNFDPATVQGEIFFLRDTGEVRLQPESHEALREGLAPWLGEATLTTLTVFRTPVYQGDGCFNWVKHPDCTDGLYVLAKVTNPQSGGISTHEASFRRNRHGDPWPIDVVGRPMTWGTMELLSQTATATLICRGWFDEQARLHRPGEALRVQPEGFSIITAGQYATRVAQMMLERTRAATGNNATQQTNHDRLVA
jgi:hypothetical protein